MNSSMPEYHNVNGHYEVYINGEFISSEDTKAEAIEAAEDFLKDKAAKEEALEKDLNESYNRTSDFY